MRQTARLWWGVALVAMGASGCLCGEAPVERQLALVFVSPVDGQLLTANDEVDQAASGFQVDVVVDVVDQDKNAVEVERATVATRAVDQAEFLAGPPPTVEGNRLTFSRVTLSKLANQLRVVAKEQGTVLEVSTTITVNVGSDTPAVAIASPAEGQTLLEGNDANGALAGYQVRFAIDAPGLSGSTGVVSCDNVCGLPPASFTVGDDGKANVEVTLLDGPCESLAPSCVASVTSAAKQTISSTPRGFKLDAMAPKVEIALPAAPVSTRTFRVEATVGCAEDGQTATLSRAGGATLTASVQSGAVVFPAVTVDVDGTYAYSLKVSDKAGNSTTKTFDVVVAAAPPTLAVSLGTNQTVDADGTSPGFQAVATATVNSEPQGTAVTVQSSVSGSLGMGREVVTVQVGADRSATYLVDLAEGNNTVKTCVQNAAGVKTCDLRTVTVSTGRPLCRITNPLDGDVKRAVGNPFNVAVESNNGSVSVQVYKAGAAVGAPVVGTASGGQATIPVTLSTDGVHKLVATCPGGGVSQGLQVSLDTVAPAVASADIRGDAAKSGKLGSNILDTSLSPGVQVILDLQTEPHAKATVTGCALASGVVTTANASGQAAVRGITVPSSGACTLTVKVADLAGNETTVTKALTLSLSGGGLFVASPTPGPLGPGSGTVGASGGLTTSISVGFGAVVGSGKLILTVGPTTVGVVDLPAGATSHTFDGVALSEGANNVRAVLVDGAGTASCTVARYDVRTVVSTISLLAPAPPTQKLVWTNDVDKTASGLQAGLAYSLAAPSSSAVVDVCIDTPIAGATSTPCRDGSGWVTLATGVPASSTSFSYPEGVYKLKVVYDDGASLAVSSEVSLTVDSVRPAVVGVSFRGDTSPADNRLNIAELASIGGGAPIVDVTTSGLVGGETVRVLDGTTRTQYGTATATAGGAAAVTLSALPGGERDVSLIVEVVDANGNTNQTGIPAPTALDPLNTQAFRNLRVDPSAPTVLVTSPLKAVLGPADDASGAGGFQIRVSANTSADVGTNGLVFAQTTPAGSTVSVTPSGNSGSHDFTVTQAGTTAYAFTVTATDVAGNSTSQVVNVTADFDAPVVTVTAPTAAGGPYGSFSIATTVSVSGVPNGTSVRVYSQIGAGAETQVGTLTVTSGTASGTLTYPFGVQTVRAEATDAAGNTGSGSQPNVNVAGSGCSVQFTQPASDPVSLNISNDAVPGTATVLDYTLQGTASGPSCGSGATVTLYREDPGPVWTQIKTTTTTGTATSGTFSFAMTGADAFPEGTLRLKAEMTVGQVTSDTVNMTIDLTRPDVSAVTPTGANVYFVADSNEFLRSSTPGYVEDKSTDGDAEADLNFTVSGAANGTVQVFYQGVAISTPPTPVTTSPQTLTIPVVLTHNTSGTLEIRATDPAGNVRSYTTSATVDVIPPGAPAFTVGPTVTNVRAATVTMTWGATYDDGTSVGSGNHQGYDFRWATNATTTAGMDTEAIFWDTTAPAPLVKRETGALLPNSTLSYTLNAPPFSDYSIAVRARDEVGNYSRWAGATAVSNVPAPVVFSNPGTNTAFGANLFSAGDLNGDGYDDLVVGAHNSSVANPGTTYILWGQDNLGQPLTYQAISVGTAGVHDFFGFDMSVGQVGDQPAPDTTYLGRPDLLIGAPLWKAPTDVATTTGRAMLFFGKNAAVGGGTLDVDAARVIEFRGEVGISSEFGRAAQIIGDINGDGLGELVITASAYNSNQGRVYLFFGRSRQAWLDLQSAQGGFVPADQADRFFAGPGGADFGRQRGFAYLGDLSSPPDGMGEFTIPHSNDAINNMYLFSGLFVTSPSPPRSPPIIFGTGDAFQTINRGPVSSGATNNGFGGRALGALNLFGTSAPELVVTQSRSSQLHIYADGNASGYAGAPYTIQGLNFFGFGLAKGDLNGDGRLDLVSGESQTTNNSFWILYNHASSGDEFDRTTGAGFRQSKFSGTQALGVGLAVGDFNHDLKPDIAAGDNRPTTNRVTIWY